MNEFDEADEQLRRQVRNLMNSKSDYYLKFKQRNPNFANDVLARIEEAEQIRNWLHRDSITTAEKDAVPDYKSRLFEMIRESESTACNHANGVDAEELTNDETQMTEPCWADVFDAFIQSLGTLAKDRRLPRRICTDFVDQCQRAIEPESRTDKAGSPTDLLSSVSEIRDEIRKLVRRCCQKFLNTKPGPAELFHFTCRFQALLDCFYEILNEQFSMPKPVCES